MRNFFEKPDSGRGLAIGILVTLAFAAPLALLAVRGLRLENDIATWLSDTDPDSRVYSWSLEQFPSDDRIVVTWDGSTLDDPRIADFQTRLTGTIDADGVRRGGAPQIQSVLTPQDVISEMTEQDVPLADAIERLQGVIIGTGGLKIRLTDAGSEDRDATIRLLTESSRSRCGLEIQTRPAVERWVPATGESDPAVLSAAIIPEHDLELTWTGFVAAAPQVEAVRQLVLQLSDFPTASEPSGRRLVEDCFIAPGSPVAITIALSDAGEADLAGAVAAIRAAAESAEVPAESLHIGGRPVALAALDQAVKSAAWNADASVWQASRRSVMVLAVLSLFAVVLYVIRKVRLAAALIGVSTLAVLFGVAVVPWTGHSMNMLLLVLPALLLAVAMTTGVHIAAAWRNALRDDPRAAVQPALHGVRRPATIAGLMTVAGFLLLTISSNSPIRQFGLYAAGGVLTSIAVVLVGLPAVLSLLQPTEKRASLVADGRWFALGAVLSRRPVLIAAGFCLICAAGLSGLHVTQIDTRVVRNFPATDSTIRDYQFMEDNLAGVAPFDVIVRFSPESQESVRFLERLEIVRRVEEQLRAHPQVSGALSLADFLPVQEIPAADAKTRQRVLFNRRSNEVEQEIKQEHAMETSDYLVTAVEARDLLTEGDAGLNRAGDEIWKMTVHTALMSDVDYAALTAELSAAARGVTRYHAGTDHVVTGAAPILDRTQRSMIRSLLKVSGLACFLLGIALIVMLKNPFAALARLLANILPVACILGVAAWCGESLDVASFLAGTIALWLGVHNTLQTLHAFRDGLRRGLTRQGAMLEAYTRCAPPIALAGAAVAIGLLALSPAELGYISRFAWTGAAMASAQSLGGIVLLPALLAGPLGALFETSVPVRLAADGTVGEQHRAAPHVRFQPADAARDAVRPAV
jgi:predicted RND superfamily exporter protein